MFALAAVILFVVALFVLSNVHVWIFWALLGLIALALHSVFDVALPLGRRAPRA